MKNVLCESIHAAAFLDFALPEVDGYTSERTRRLLNLLCRELPLSEVYCEVGTFKGSTFVAALYETGACGFSIDNWSEYGTEREARDNVRRLLGPDHEARIITGNCFDVLQNRSLPKIGVFFYDGAHTEDATYRALITFYANCADEFVLLVDDWNWQDVRRGTFCALADLPHGGFEHYSLLTEGNGDAGSWWNGIGAFWIRKSQSVEPMKRCEAPHDLAAYLTSKLGSPDVQ